MTLKEMLETLRTIGGSVEIRDEYNNKIGTFPFSSEAISFYEDRKIKEWFPGAAPGENCSFTVSLAEKDGEKNG